MCLPGWIDNIMSNLPLFRLIGICLFITAFPALIAWLICCINNSIIRRAIIAVLVLLFAINIFLELNFSTLLSPWILLLCYETNSTESREFISHYVFLWPSIYSYLIVFITILTVFIVEKKQNNFIIFPKYTFTIFAIWFLIGIMQVFLIGTMFTKKTAYDLQIWYLGKAAYCIDNSISRLIYSFYHLNLNNQEMKVAEDTCEKAAHIHSNCLASNDSIDVVVIIGESFNKHHGYQLNTTPIMKREKDKNNLFVFKDAITPYNMTTLAVKNMLSTNSLNKNQQWTHYPPFTIIFHQAGYDVAMWDNQRVTGNVGFHDFSINSFLYNPKMISLAYDHVNKNTYDYDLDLVDSTLDIKRYKQHTLTIFHLMGQHMVAKKRFPNKKDFNIFTIKDIHHSNLTLEQQQNIADYDNATYYNDTVVGHIIDHYKQRNAVIVYLSDHGEEVYDYRAFIGRSQETVKTPEILKYQYQIPFIIWCSNSYQQRYPEAILHIKEALNKPWSSDNLSHLLFTLGFINTSFYQPENDLLNNQYKYRQRIVQNTVKYDEIMK